MHKTAESTCAKVTYFLTTRSYLPFVHAIHEIPLQNINTKYLRNTHKVLISVPTYEIPVVHWLLYLLYPD